MRARTSTSDSADDAKQSEKTSEEGASPRNPLPKRPRRNKVRGREGSSRGQQLTILIIIQLGRPWDACETRRPPHSLTHI
eukprot:1516322-Amphidinium_carterae.1